MVTRGRVWRRLRRVVGARQVLVLALALLLAAGSVLVLPLKASASPRGAVGHPGMHLAWEHLLPATVDDLAVSAGQGQETVAVHGADVAGVEPPVGVEPLAARTGAEQHASPVGRLGGSC